MAKLFCIAIVALLVIVVTSKPVDEPSKPPAKGTVDLSKNPPPRQTLPAPDNANRKTRDTPAKQPTNTPSKPISNVPRTKPAQPTSGNHPAAAVPANNPVRKTRDTKTPSVAVPLPASIGNADKNPAQLTKPTSNVPSNKPDRKTRDLKTPVGTGSTDDASSTNIKPNPAQVAQALNQGKKPVQTNPARPARDTPPNYGVAVTLPAQITPQKQPSPLPHPADFKPQTDQPTRKTRDVSAPAVAVPLPAAISPEKEQPSPVHSHTYAKPQSNDQNRKTRDTVNPSVAVPLPAVINKPQALPAPVASQTNPKPQSSDSTRRTRDTGNINRPIINPSQLTKPVPYEDNRPQSFLPTPNGPRDNDKDNKSTPLSTAATTKLNQ